VVELGAQRLGGRGVFFFELLDVVDDVTTVRNRQVPSGIFTPYLSSGLPATPPSTASRCPGRRTNDFSGGDLEGSITGDLLR